jgi:cation/acetate symporter
MLHTNPILGGSAAAQWFHIAPISAGVFGVPAGIAVLVVAVSLLTRAPDAHTASLIDHIRAPE